MRIILLAAAIIAAGVMARAHDWYPYTCCSSKDCYSIAWTDVEPVEDGWRIKATGEVIPYEQVRETPAEGGGQFHRCSIKGDRTRNTIGLSSGRACFWAPPMGY